MALTTLVKSFAYFLLGVLAFSGMLLLLVLTFPILLYRCIVCYVLAPMYRPHIGNVVGITGQAFATEFIRSKQHLPPRSSMVLGFGLDAYLGREEFMELIQERWISAKTEDKSEKLLYPELQQYIEQWMGFMFWKQDKNFLLENHIIEHEVGQCATPMESKNFVDKLIEELLNKKFLPKRSPWELHLVQNYKDPEINKEGMTVVLFRSHHAIGDGYTLSSMVQEAMRKTPLSNSGPLYSKSKKVGKASKSNKVFGFVKFVFKALTDVGYATSLLWRHRTPWHCPDRIKHWKQLYSRSPLIPISKIKFIKNKLGCTFTAVMLSSVSAAVVQSFKRKTGNDNTKIVPTGIPVPLPGHPKGLKNHVTGTIVELTTEYQLDPYERLCRLEASLNKAQNSTFPFIMPIAQKLASFSIAPMVRAFVTNNAISMAFSNFPGPFPIKLNGRTAQTLHVCGGGFLGCAGMSLVALSYGDHIAMTAAVEASLMDHTDLEFFIQSFLKEIDNLYEIALKGV